MADGDYERGLAVTLSGAYRSFEQCLGPRFDASSLSEELAQFDEFGKLLVIALIALRLQSLSPPPELAQPHDILARAADRALISFGASLSTALADFEDALRALLVAAGRPPVQQRGVVSSDEPGSDRIAAMYRRTRKVLADSGGGAGFAVLGRYFEVDSTGTVRWKPNE